MTIPGISVVNDIWFQNTVDYRLAAMRSSQIDSYAETISEIDQVLALLDSELAR